MYRGLSYMPHEHKMRLFTWSEDGDRITTDIEYNPYFYYQTNNKHLQTATSLYGTKLRKVTCRSEKDRRNKIQDLGIDRIFENITPYQQFLIDSYWDKNEKDDFINFLSRIGFLILRFILQMNFQLQMKLSSLLILLLFTILQIKCIIPGVQENISLI